MRGFLRLYRDAFRGLPRAVWILALASFVNRAGAMVLPFLTIYMVQEQGMTLGQAGDLLAIFGLGALVGITIGGRLTDRIGFLPVQVGALTLGGLTIFALGSVDAHAWIRVLVFVLGLASEGFRPANSTAIAAFSPPAIRARSYGLHRLAINLGWTIGPVVGGLLAEVDYAWLFRVDGGTCLAAGGILGLALAGEVRRAAEAAPDGPSGPAPSPWRDGPFLAVLVLLALQGLVFFQMLGALPLFMSSELGFDEGTIGRVLAVNAVIIVLFEMPLVKRIETLPTLRLVGAAGLLVGIGYGLLPWGSGVLFVALTVVVWTLGEMISNPPMMTFVANRASDANRGRYMGMFSVMLSLSFVAAPWIGMRVYEAFGAATLWHACLVIGVVDWLAFEALARWLRRYEEREGAQ